MHIISGKIGGRLQLLYVNSCLPPDFEPLKMFPAVRVAYEGRMSAGHKFASSSMRQPQEPWSQLSRLLSPLAVLAQLLFALVNLWNPLPHHPFALPGISDHGLSIR